MIVSMTESFLFKICRESPKTCANCKLFHYCDRKCQKEDWNSFHKHNECKFYTKVWKRGFIVRPLCRATASFWLMLRLYLLIKAKPEVVNQKYLVSDGIELSFADLLSDDGKQQQFRMEIDVAVALFREIDSEFLSDKADVNLMTEVFHKIRINSHFIPHEVVNGAIGEAISVHLSALNHSCRPNTFGIIKGNGSKVRVLRDIAVGEEITMNFVNIDYPKSDRQVSLAKTKHLICKCERCEAGDTPEELEAMKRIIGRYRFRFSSPDAINSPVLFDMMVDDLQIREKYQGPFHPSLTHDMLDAVRVKMIDETPLTAKDKENMRMLMDKINTAWPITHGPDHAEFGALPLMNDRVNRLCAGS
jgi:hypothetical protein